MKTDILAGKEKGLLITDANKGKLPISYTMIFFPPSFPASMLFSWEKLSMSVWWPYLVLITFLIRSDSKSFTQSCGLKGQDYLCSNKVCLVLILI